MGNLDGKVAIITGAGNGIGKSHALYFAEQGAKVVVNDLGGARDGEGSDGAVASQVVEEIRGAGGEAVPSFDSVATGEGADAMIRTALDAFGRLDILVNNAGILRDKTLVKMEDSMWDAVMAVHLRGTFLCTRAAVRQMRLQNEAGDAEGGRIINTTSISGLLGNFGQGNYGAAKAGVYGFTRCVSQETKKHRITVNCVAPVAHTRLTADIPMFMMPGMGEAKMGPQYIAPVVAFLASDLAADITGEVIGVAGARVYRFKMVEGAGVVHPEGQPWTPEELRERWAEISRI